MTYAFCTTKINTTKVFHFYVYQYLFFIPNIPKADIELVLIWQMERSDNE